jgi:hypothetical protein
MPEQKYSVERDLKEAQEMAKALVPYIYQDQLYGNVGGGMFGSRDMPKLTIGGLLMRIHRLHSVPLTATQQQTLSEVENQLASVRTEWRMHYDEKLVHEANSRLDGIESFIQECREDPRACGNAYMPEAQRRTIVQEILHELESLGALPNELKTKMLRVDSQLHGYVHAGDFIWSPELRSVYPKSAYWWLYGKPAS